MFANHQPVIGAWARAHPDNMHQVIKFVIATVQQSIEEASGPILQDFDAHGPDSRFAFAWKADALAHYGEHFETIHADAIAIYAAAESDREAAIALTAYFAALPGLGLVKGGFVVQLCFGVSGCIDSHNLKRYNIAPGPFTASAFKNLRSPESRAARAARYVDLVEQCGGTEALWDEWCDYVATLRPDRFSDGYDVSELHVSAFGLRALGEDIPF